MTLLRFFLICRYLYREDNNTCIISVLSLLQFVTILMTRRLSEDKWSTSTVPHTGQALLESQLPPFHKQAALVDIEAPSVRHSGSHLLATLVPTGKADSFSRWTSMTEATKQHIRLLSGISQYSILLSFLNNTYFLRAVLSLQKNWAERSEGPHIPLLLSPLTTVSPVINILHC